MQLGSVGRLGMTYVLVSTADSRQSYRIAGAYCVVITVHLRLLTNTTRNHPFLSGTDLYAV